MNPQSLDEVILGARLYGPEDALRVGLVDEVAAAAEAVARQRLAELASYPADAYGAAKWAIRGGVLDIGPGPAPGRARGAAAATGPTRPCAPASARSWPAKAQAKKS